MNDVVTTRLEDGVRQHVEQEGDVGLDAADAGLLQGAAHAQERLLERRAARGVLDEQRVDVVGRDRHARVADAVSMRMPKPAECAGRQ